MPKETRVNRFSSNFSPYPCSSNNPNNGELDRGLGSPDDIKQWEEIMCPFCLDIPHNAVLLRCSSSRNGCRPYVCNTGVRHSNCLEQFCKLLASSMEGRLPETSSATGRRRVLQGLTRAGESKLRCPLCRGEIHGWSVVEAARKFMNSKSRNCSCETCDFSGNFAELRRHVRSEHPFARPSEADPERQKNWVQLEHQRTLLDLISLSRDQSQDNLGGQEDSENLSTHFLFRYITGSNSNIPTNIFPITRNTPREEHNFRQNISSTRSILPTPSDRRADPEYTTLNHRQNNGVGSFTERVCWVSQSIRSAVRRPPVGRTRQRPRRR